MIERIRIRNFQVHEDLDLSFEPVTTITGSNDSGKSSIMRAIRWVLYNQPRGDKFIRWGTNAASVMLRIDDRTVKRERGPSVNAYHLDGEKYTSFDSNQVPKTIADFLNVGPDNAQVQDAAVFWFSDTAGEVAKKLNAVINLTEIDDAMEFAASEVRRAKSIVGFTEDRLKQAEEDADQTKWADRFDAALINLEELANEHGQVVADRGVLQTLLTAGEQINAERKRLDAAYTAGTELVRLGTEAIAARDERTGLETLLATVERLEAQAVDPPDLSEVMALRDAAITAGQRRVEMEHWVEIGEQLEDELCQLDEELSEHEETLKRMGASRCPTCGNLSKKATSH
jgi:hypothetical protein